MNPATLPPAVATLPIALFSLQLAAFAWLGLELLARQFRADTLGRVLLQRSHLSISGASAGSCPTRAATCATW